MSTYRFRPAGSDYQPGDERSYYVSVRGVTIGEVETTWLPSRFVDGEPIRGWSFGTFDNSKTGEGRTRAEAVTNALKEIK